MEVLKTRLLICLFGLLLTKGAAAQQVEIGKWREHFGYQEALSVCMGSGKVYCATSGGLFSVNLQDNRLERMSKVNGLSDIQLSRINYNDYNNCLIIGYKNGNLDLIKNNTITNISDIKREPDLGDKTIYSITFDNELAYLSCGFGIVVIDTDKEEVKDTYKIGPGGAYVKVYDVAIADTGIFAATDEGIFQASLNSTNLVFFGAWNKMSGIPVGEYNAIESFSGKIVANFSKRLTSGAYLEDTVLLYDRASQTWSKMLEGGGVIKDGIRDLKVDNSHLLIVCDWYISEYDQAFTRTRLLHSYGLENSPVANQAIQDQSGVLFIADRNYGMVQLFDNSRVKTYCPNGPRRNAVYNMEINENVLWAVPGGVGDAYHNLYNIDGLSVFSEEHWSTTFGEQGLLNMDSLYDLLDVTIDPSNNKHVYAASYGKGLLEFNNGSLVNLYNEYNSSLSSRPEFRWIGAAGSAFDEAGNLWVSNSNVSNCLSVRKTDGSWQAFNFLAFGVNSQTAVGNIIIDRAGQKWILLPGKGALVYNDEGSFASPSAANTKKVTIEKGSGGLPSNEVLCLAQDDDGEMWVGTNKGIAVFYSPESIFSSGNWDAQQILIEQDGHIQKLLETETVLSIAVDGANRKWIGTASSGVYLVSEDGTEEINHFTETNSPLLSNEVKSIVINGESGEVFFGTSNGIISYRSRATEGDEFFESVYAFPNPVRPDYEGDIAIKGLVTNADVKITDVSGGLVYSTTALGGQAIWDGKNFEGQKVKTGVYLVFASNDDGSKTVVAKILFIN